MRFHLPKAVLLFFATAVTVSACDLHQHMQRDIPVDTLTGPHVRRHDVEEMFERRAEPGARDWDYAGASSWGSIKPGTVNALHYCKWLTSHHRVRPLQHGQAAVSNQYPLKLWPGHNP